MDKRKAYETLTKLSAELLRGCEKTAPDGTVLFTPDGLSCAGSVRTGGSPTAWRRAEKPFMRRARRVRLLGWRIWTTHRFSFLRYRRILR